MRCLPLTCLLLFTLAWLPATAEEPAQPAAGANQTEAQEDAPEPPHYYRWVDAKGQTHFSDKPPEEQHKKVEKEALTPAPKLGNGSNLTRIYQRANAIMTPPAPAGQAPSGWGQHLKPATTQENQPIQPDAPIIPPAH